MWLFLILLLFFFLDYQFVFQNRKGCHGIPFARHVVFGMRIYDGTYSEVNIVF